MSTGLFSCHLDSWTILSDIKRASRKSCRKQSIRPWESLQEAQGLWSRLNRVRVLSEDVQECHSGCVNALHWSCDGSVLLSAGDDTRIHLWRLDPSQSSGVNDYPLNCAAQIHTGHTGNIFGAHILGNSSQIVTCAADCQVRVFDINRAGLYHRSGELTEYQEEQACIKTFTCHRGRVKRILTEESPNYFLTVSEDGTIRQHDLRSPHRCSYVDSPSSCPTPLLLLPIELSTISMSRLTPYNFVVAGQSPYAFMFDRRHISRRVKEDWGVTCSDGHLTSCVRRFGRTRRGEKEISGNEHITGSRMSSDNGHELLLSYSSDAVYLYSTRDCPHAPNKRSFILPSTRSSPLDRDEARDSSDGEESAETENSDFSQDMKQPVVHPRRRYEGLCNVETVKDVNFLGPKDNFIVSGSDDGNFFIWDKASGEIVDIHEGDATIVNVIEQHPFLPILAVSGIDETIKIFAPSAGERQSSRMSRKHEILLNNKEQRPSRLSRGRLRFSQLLLRYRELAAGESDSGESLEDVECVHQ